MIKSPLNYIGGKTKLLNQLLPLFPKKIEKFIDLFAGGCNVGANAKAEEYFFNDNLTPLINMYESFLLNDIENTLKYIKDKINELKLSKQNLQGYNQLRLQYNETKEPLDLFVLISFSFNHQIRYNNKHQFNVPFGKGRSSFNIMMENNLIQFIRKIKNINATFSSLDFNLFNFDVLTKNDFVYCDPPYLITTGSYNDGKRGYKGWTEKEEIELLQKLDELNNKDIQFGLSNVIEHKGKKNEILHEWIKNNDNYFTNYLNMHYKNSNYQTKNKKSKEVFITNYKPDFHLSDFPLNSWVCKQL